MFWLHPRDIVVESKVKPRTRVNMFNLHLHCVTIDDGWISIYTQGIITIYTQAVTLIHPRTRIEKAVSYHRGNFSHHNKIFANFT